MLAFDLGKRLFWLLFERRPGLQAPAERGYY